MPEKRFITFALFLIASPPLYASAQDLSTDPFVAQIVGEWSGTGAYDGNPLTLTRFWTLDLLDQFLRADLKVHMPNGFSFGALMYWKAISPNVYEVAWMDGTGRLQNIRATRDSDTNIVSSVFLDEIAEYGPEWRSWEFEFTGTDTYVQRLYNVGAEVRELEAGFSFVRE